MILNGLFYKDSRDYSFDNLSKNSNKNRHIIIIQKQDDQNSLIKTTRSFILESDRKLSC